MKLIYSISFFLLIILNWQCQSTDDSQAPPNIVWITSEDNSVHYMELFSENGVPTPHIEKLAQTGLKFTRAFSNTPVCSAARSTLISGCYGPRFASHYHRKQKAIPLPEEINMFPAYLREAGYYTTNNSKEDYNFIKPEGVWDESSKTASWRNREQGQPFFHVFNITTSHESRLHFSRKDMENPTRTDTSSFFVHPNHPQTSLFRYTNAYYRDKIQEMDQEVGQVISDLEQDQLLDDTFVFYFADHGGVLPGSKGYLYETGLHVPLLVHIPQNYRHLVNAEIGTEVNGFVSFVDFAPTVLNLAGVKIPEQYDGQPFLGPFMDQVEERNLTFSYADRFDEKYDMVRAVRQGKYKYIRSFQPFNIDGLMNNYRYIQLAYQEWQEMYEQGQLNQVQSRFYQDRPVELLFDLEADPFETKNLAAEPQYAEIKKNLHQQLHQWMIALPDLSLYPEFHLVQHALDNVLEFGRQHKEDISHYLTIADLGLQEFEQVKTELGQCLNAEDPWVRYWGLINCCIFQEKALDLLPRIREIGQNDPELINRVRAAEFLGITGKGNPVQLMENALYSSQHGTEALLMLNAIVLMQDQYHFQFDIEADKLSPEVREHGEVNRRLKYLEVVIN
ncbi:MAG: sulfatase family protein [Candidatus Cyclobacteriaceae bacterium M3_2C_046]